MTNTTEQSYQEIYRQAFPKLVVYLQHRHRCSMQDAEDIAAQALHILWTKWDTLETHTGAGMLRWLLVTAQNLMRDETKRRQRKPQPLSLEELTESEHPFALPEFIQSNDEAYDTYITEIMRRLSENDAALFRAKIVDRKTDEEIATQLGITANALRVRWLRVKRRIHAMWDDLPPNA